MAKWSEITFSMVLQSGLTRKYDTEPATKGRTVRELLEDA